MQHKHSYQSKPCYDLCYFLFIFLWSSFWGPFQVSFLVCLPVLQTSCLCSLSLQYMRTYVTTSENTTRCTVANKLYSCNYIYTYIFGGITVCTLF